VNNLQIHIITGLSGSGKSTAIAAFEDAGFFCVDNMPVALLPKFLEQPTEYTSEVAGFAFVMDLREKDLLSTYPPVFKSIQQQGYKLSIIFLEADEDVLLRRYSYTRRHHPLSRDKSLVEGIRFEKKQLNDLRKISNNIINTSQYNVHELKSTILKIAQQGSETSLMRVNILSFGFKQDGQVNS